MSLDLPKQQNHARQWRRYQSMTQSYRTPCARAYANPQQRRMSLTSVSSLEVQSSLLAYQPIHQAALMNHIPKSQIHGGKKKFNQLSMQINSLKISNAIFWTLRDCLGKVNKELVV